MQARDYDGAPQTGGFTVWCFFSVGSAVLAKEIPNAVASVPSCSSGQAECRMIQQCIPLAAVCDMKVDCLDGSDEESCGQLKARVSEYIHVGKSFEVAVQ